jgi:hypothetical protein
MVHITINKTIPVMICFNSSSILLVCSTDMGCQ